MSNYSNDPASVLVDFFKPSGKWYCTEAVVWTGGYKDCCIHDAFEKSLRDHLKGRLEDMQAICLEPYHEHSHPISMKVI